MLSVWPCCNYAIEYANKYPIVFYVQNACAEHVPTHDLLPMFVHPFEGGRRWIN